MMASITFAILFVWLFISTFMSGTLHIPSFSIGAIGMLLVLSNFPITFGLLRKIVAIPIHDGAIISKRRGEIYGIGHQLLNINSSSMWLNFGYWDSQLLEELSQIIISREQSRLILTSDLFKQACETLASKLAEYVGLNKEDSILDVGFGCGDQILFWNEKYGVKKIIGITNEYSHLQIAKSRIHLESVFLYQGDAANIRDIESIKLNRFDKVLSLDSAYHYHTRYQFLKESFEILKPGGSIALSDIVIKNIRNSSSKKILQFLFRLADYPKENLVTVEEYEQQLESIGYKDIKIEIITENVWKGFILFLKVHKERFGRFIANEKWMQYDISAKFLSWISNGKCDYVLVTAKKPQQL